MRTLILSMFLASSLICNIMFISVLHQQHIEKTGFKIGDHVTNGNCDGYIAGLTDEEAYFVEFNCGSFYFSKAYVRLSMLKLKEKPNNENKSK